MIKLRDLFEVMKAGLFQEYSTEQLHSAIQWLSDAKELTKLEGGKFSIIKKETFYAIKKLDKIAGWINIIPITINGKQYNSVKIIYVLPEFRKSRVVIILLHGLTEVLTDPILIDGAIFTDGERLIDAISERNLHKVYIMDKKTFDKAPYENKSIDYDDSKSYIIIESKNIGLFECYLPGDSSVKSYYSFFEDLHEIEK